MTDITDAYSGGRSYTGQATEYDISTDPAVGTPGTYVSPTTGFVPVKSNTLKPVYARTKEKVQTNTRFTHRVNQPSYLTVEGDITWILNRTMGPEYFQAGLGAKVHATSIAATTSASNVTANGVTTLTFAAGPTIVAGRPVEIGTGSTMECVPVYSVDTTAHTITTPALVNHASTASGLSVSQPTLDNYANSNIPATLANKLGLLSVERNFGGLWAWGFPSVYVEKLGFTYNNNTCEVQASLFGTKMPMALNASSSPVMAAYNPNSSDEDEALKALTGINVTFHAGGDPHGTGTSALQAAIGGKNLKIDFDNALIKENILGSPVVQAFPGDDAMCQISYEEIDTADRPAVWDDYVALGGGYAIHAFTAKNFGTTASPTYHGVHLYVPYFVPEDAAFTDAIGQVGTSQIKGEAQVKKGLPSDLLQITTF